MEWVKIDGVSYDVIVKSISEDFNILYSENTGRSVSVGARMILDPLGTFFGHKVVFARRNGKENHFDELFKKLSTPRYEGIDVEIVHYQSTLKYSAYVSQGSRVLRKIDEKTGKVYWGEFEVSFIPMEAQVTP